MAKVRLRVKKEAKLPSFKLPRSFWREAGRAIEGGIIEGILKQQSPDGSRLKVNAPSTHARKSRKGRALLSLVDEHHRLVKGGEQSFKTVYMSGGKGIRVVPATSEVKKITRYVVRMGYDFMGISKDTAAAIQQALVKAVRRMLQRAE